MSMPVLLASMLAGCGGLPVARVDGHINAGIDFGRLTASNPPSTVNQVPLPPPPQPKLEEVKYSITVKDVPVQDILFAISRDTNVNIDVHSGIEGRVTLNAIDQTLKQILTRISRQVDMRFEVEGSNIVVRPDAPFLRLYHVDYVNMQRDSTGSIGVQTQVVGPGGASGGSSGGGGTGGGSNSTVLKIDNTSKNRFWDNLEKNVRDILRETDKLLPEGSSETFVRGQSQGQSATTQQQISAQRGSTQRSTAKTNVTGPGNTESQSESQTVAQTLTFREAASVIVNPETGTLSVRATSRQHEKVTEFIARVSGSASRQVLIEATVVEVTLNDNYQSGVDWSALALNRLGYSFVQAFTGSTNIPSSGPGASISYNNPRAAAGGSISSTIKLLDSFGTSKVLSSPRITTLNNQTAVMKVVENRVYFTVKADLSQVSTATGTTSTPIISYTSTPNVVPEGFVMSVTPQISDGDIVTLNVRPSITRITSYVNDPNPDLARASVTNQVPVIQSREFETLLRIPSGQTAVLGGLMLDSFETKRDGLPIISRLKFWGDATSYRNDTGRKTELIVFIRPIVIKDASVNTDFSGYRRYLPDAQYFKEAEPPLPGLYPGYQKPDITPAPSQRSGP